MDTLWYFSCICLTGSGVLAMMGLDILELDILTPMKVEMTYKMKVVSYAMMDHLISQIKTQ